MPILKSTYMIVEEVELPLSTLDSPSIGDYVDQAIAQALVSPDQPVLGKVELMITPDEWKTMRGDAAGNKTSAEVREAATRAMTPPGKRR